MADASNGKRINFELGSELLVELVDDGIKFKSLLVGMRSDEYLIVRSPDLQQVRNQIYDGSRLIARCVHSGSIYGFRSKILCNLVHPAVRLLILEYPTKVESVNIRKSPRVDCHLPAEIEYLDKFIGCAILDLSVGGCKLVVKPAEGRETFTAKVDQKIALRAQLLGLNGNEILTGIIRNFRTDGNMIIVGVNFIDLDESIIGALNRFIESMLDLFHY